VHALSNGRAPSAVARVDDIGQEAGSPACGSRQAQRAEEAAGAHVALERTLTAASLGAMRHQQQVGDCRWSRHAARRREPMRALEKTAVGRHHDDAGQLHARRPSVSGGAAASIAGLSLEGARRGGGLLSQAGAPSTAVEPRLLGVGDAVERPNCRGAIFSQCRARIEGLARVSLTDRSPRLPPSHREQKFEGLAVVIACRFPAKGTYTLYAASDARWHTPRLDTPVWARGGRAVSSNHRTQR
jgi:hypothetical protein